jgi:hypothetical protein
MHEYHISLDNTGLQERTQSPGSASGRQRQGCVARCLGAGTSGCDHWPAGAGLRLSASPVRAGSPAGSARSRWHVCTSWLHMRVRLSAETGAYNTGDASGMTKAEVQPTTHHCAENMFGRARQSSKQQAPDSLTDKCQRCRWYIHFRCPPFAPNCEASVARTGEMSAAPKLSLMLCDSCVTSLT